MKVAKAVGGQEPRNALKTCENVWVDHRATLLNYCKYRFHYNLHHKLSSTGYLRKYFDFWRSCMKSKLKLMCSKERGTWSRAFLSVSRLAMSLPCVPLSLLETLVTIPCSQVQAPLPKQCLVFSDSLASSVGAAHFNNSSKRLQFAKGVAEVSESNLGLCQHQNILSCNHSIPKHHNLATQLQDIPHRSSLPAGRSIIHNHPQSKRHLLPNRTSLDLNKWSKK